MINILLMSLQSQYFMWYLKELIKYTQNDYNKLSKLLLKVDSSKRTFL